jgi:hypothetical protein
MAHARYGQVMTILIFLSVAVVMIAAIVGYVTWRNRRSRRSFVDPFVSRGAFLHAERRAVQGRLAEADMLGTDLLGYGPGAHSRVNQT